MTVRHLTLFEMLGNFSFGDYSRRSPTAWGTELDHRRVWDRADRLWITVFDDDDVSVGAWIDGLG